MAGLQELESALVKADAAGDQEAARAFAGEIRRMRSAGGAGEASAPRAPLRPLTRDNQNPIDAAITGFLAGKPELTNTLERQIGMGSPAAGVALGAASLPLGGLQLGIRALGGEDQAIRDVYQQRSRATGGGFDVPQLAGTFLNPLPIKAATAMPAAKTAGEGIRQGMLLGGGIGAGSPVTEEGNFLANKAGQVAAGTAIGGVIPGFLAAGGAAYRGARNLIDPMLPGGTERAAARGAAEAIGDRMQAVRGALANPQTIVPGSTPTAGEAATAAGSTELSGLQRLAAQKVDPSGYRDIAKAQEAARLGQIESIGQTPQALQQAVSARGNKAALDYGNAFAQQIKGDPELVQMSNNPYFKNALPVAMDLAKANGITPKNNLTEFLHYVKLELDAQLAGTSKTAISRSEDKAVASLKDNLVQWLAKKNPEYEFARTNFASASRPINEMQVGQELAQTLRQPTELGERVSSFAGAMRDAPKVIKSATGNARYESLDQVLTPQNVQKVDAVLSDMLRKGEFEQMASKGLPRATSIMAQAVPEISPVGGFNMLLSTARSWVNRLAGKLDDEALAVLSESLKTPAGLSALLDKLPSPTRRAMLEKIMTLGERGSVIGATDAAMQ